MVERAKITLKGIVQGVGFRPYVYNLAESLHLKGYVTNTSDGVTIDIEGEKLIEFIERLPKESPPLSQIVDISIVPLPEYGYADFRIIESKDDGGRKPFTLISPDVSICDDCLKELLDPSNRRYLYPFINCTNCGPRYTITKSIPYDRPNTTMAHFQMCRECHNEYNNPNDRRFHAQPNACPKCGPQVELKVKSNPPFSKGERGGFSDEMSRVSENGNPMEATINLLKAGAIVAIKGLGGFHIACDATNEEAVERLRERKRRSNKPFALMAPDIETIERFCDISEEEGNLLLSHRRPIVLLRKKERMIPSLPEAISPHNRYLGFMLPYTPLHYLLFYHPMQDITPPHPPIPPLLRGGRGGVKKGNGGITNFMALVMTSGNMSEEPIVKDNDEAIGKLSILTDAVLLHNRDIFMRVDDSVLRVISNESRVTSYELRNNDRNLSLVTCSASGGSAGVDHSSLSFIRRSRGYAPEPLALHTEGPEVMGCGADIKNTFTVTKGSFAIPSQHIGDMENYETLRFFEECLENIKSVYRVIPAAIAHDLHPHYLSTQWALRQGMKTYGIQHHYAHIGSVMAEKGLYRKVIGVAFDGTGYGTDGNLWGGEFLVAGINGFERVGHFRYIPLPGGEMAIREPWRAGISYLLDAAGNEVMDYLKAIGFVEKYGKGNIERILKVINARELSPLSSGAGRLFDAVAALIGICDRNTFEGEAAMALESLIKGETDNDYPVNIVIDKSMVVDFSQAITRIIDDIVNGVERHIISVKFHNTVSNVILRVVNRISETHRLRDVVLTGGTFQNLYLLERTRRLLAMEGINVFINEKVPCNDACISLGQAYIVRERMKTGG